MDGVGVRLNVSFWFPSGCAEKERDIFHHGKLLCGDVDTDSENDQDWEGNFKWREAVRISTV